MFLECSSRLLVLLPPVYLRQVWSFQSICHRLISHGSIIVCIPSLGRVSDIRTVSVSLSVLAAISAVMFVGL